MSQHLDRSVRSNRTARGLGALTAIVAAVSLTVGTAAAQRADDRPVSLKSVQFDLEPAERSDQGPLSAIGSPFEARYHSLVVVDDGAEVRVKPIPGTVNVTLAEQHARAMVADLNGSQVGHGTPGFADVLADALSSSSAHRFIRFSADGAAGPIGIDVFYPRTLTGDDYLLVQEGGGDSPVDIMALGPDGRPVGSTVRIGAGSGYQWNTGHGPDGDGGQGRDTAWATTLSVARFGTDQPVIGIRIEATQAEVKAMALTPAGERPSPSRSSGADGAAIVAAPPQNPPPTLVVETGDAPATTEDSGQVPAAATGAATAITVAVPPPDASPAEPTSSEPEPAEQPEPRPQPEPEPAEPAAKPEPAEQPEPAPEPQPTPQPQPAAEPESEPHADPVGAAVAAGGPVEPVEAGSAVPAAAVTQLALTGMVTEPWVLVILAMGLIFFGYTVYAAFQRPDGAEACGHDQLDSFGFD